MNTQKNVFSLKFEDFPVRFVFLKEDNTLFVSRDDIKAAIFSCMTDEARRVIDSILDESLDCFTHKTEKSGALIEIDTIGPVINIYSAGNSIHFYSKYIDSKYAELRESAFRINTLKFWYIQAFSKTLDYFGLPMKAAIDMAESHLDKYNPVFDVHVEQDRQSGYWVAECDQLGLVTEGESMDALAERVREIAPELAKENNLNINPELINFNFNFLDAACERKRL